MYHCQTTNLCAGRLAGTTTIIHQDHLRYVTVLIADADVDEGDLDSVVAAVASTHEVSRAASLAAVREALPNCSAVVVGTLPDASAAAVRETVRSGVYCDPTTPVVRLVAPAEEATATDGDYDAVVPTDTPASVVEVIDAIEQTDDYRDAVEELYEACRASARGDDVDGARLAAAFERADRAFESLPDVPGWSPYGRVFAESEADRPDGVDADDTDAEDDAD